jgi:hypothetical protein
VEELHDNGPVQSQVAPELRLFFHRGVLSDHGHDGIAHEIEQAKGDQRHHGHDGDRLQDAAQDKGKHLWSTSKVHDAHILDTVIPAHFAN